MRITSPVPQSHVQSQFRPEASDRFVRINLFVPYKTFRPLVFGNWIMGMLTGWVRDWALLMFGGSAASGSAGGGPGGIRPYILPHRDPNTIFTGAGTSGDTLGPVRTITDMNSLGSALLNLNNQVQAARLAINNSSRGTRAAGASHLIAGQIANIDRIQRRIDLLDIMRTRIDYAPLGAPPGSSEVGFLFLDQTRIRPVATDIGEPFDSVPLIPGQETVYEVRTSYRKTVGIEDSIEREYESVLEQNTQTTETENITVADQLADTTGGTIAADTRLGLKGGESIPVDASMGLNSSSTFTRAATNSTQRSLTIAATVSNRVTSRLRQNQKSVVKTETQQTFETLSRNTLRSPNLSSPITLHYYKLLQRLELQQERRGTRLCWAPFIIDPGAGVRFRAYQARDAILELAEKMVRLPAAPQPPKPESAPVWITGEALPLWAPAMGIRLFSTAGAPLDVTLEEGDTSTGVFRIDVTGRDKGAVHVKSYSAPVGPDPDRVIRTDAEFEIGVSIGELMADVSLSAQVLRVLPSYAAEMAQYQVAVADHEKEVSRLITSAREGARPAAEAAMQDIINRADPKDEILGSVFQQYVLPYFLTPAIVEHWHRLVDFENVGFVTYPGWWRRGSLPMPQYGTRHFVNAAVARAFIPFRRGMEAEALYQLFDGDNLDPSGVAKYNKFVEKVEAALGDPAVPEAVTPIGTPWVETVPVNGAHVEVEFAAYEALDPSTARQLEATVARLEEEVAALKAENTIRSGAAAGATPVLQVGPLR